ncbi:MAG: RHS repeat-associated core domain-containing protein, partial [Acidobacteriota bacterium]
GNVTNDGVHSYSYDAENRLVSVDNGATASYKYDHQNRRVSKAVGTSLTHYVWQGSQVIAEHDATTPLPGYGQPLYQVQSARVDYVYAGGKMVYSRQRTSSTGAWSERYYLSDRLSTRVVLDGLGNVIGRQAHLPFGEDFAESGTQEKHHFTSYERDGEAGTDYAVNRGYSLNVGRFQQADPYKASGYLVDPQSWNRYSYAQSDPVNFTDATGLFRKEFPDPLPPELWRDWITNPPGTDSTPPDEKGPGGGDAPITHDLCQRVLGSDQLVASRGQDSVPDVVQFHAVQRAASASGADPSLLLTTWWVENSFAENPRNNLRGSAYGPMQLQPGTASGYVQRSGYSLDQIVGDRNSRRFTGSIDANLTVGGMFLADLAAQTGGDLALAGTAYLGPGDVIGRPPDQLRGAYRDRYELYKNLLPHFQWFKDCMEEADRRLAG